MMLCGEYLYFYEVGMARASKKYTALLTKIKSLKWSDEHSTESLNLMFDEVVDLIKGQIDYYNRRRRFQKRISVFSRWSVVILGTLAALAPFLGFELPECYPEWPQLGYIALILAGGILAFNRVVGGTTGHSRYVMTQLTLERDLSLTMIRWGLYQNRLAEPSGNTPGNRAVMLTYLENVIAGAYELVLDETAAWSRVTQDSLDGYEKKLKASTNEKS